MVAIDSNYLTYMLEAITPGYDPVSDTSGLAPDRVAILRCHLYKGIVFHVLPTVRQEYLRIPQETHRRAHESLNAILFEDVSPPPDPTAVDDLKIQYLNLHPRDRDCQIVAEAVVAGVNHLLSRDQDLIDHLRAQVPVSLMPATEFWDSLAVPRGATPVAEPHPSNPLHGKQWWKW